MDAGLVTDAGDVGQLFRTVPVRGRAEWVRGVPGRFTVGGDSVSAALRSLPGPLSEARTAAPAEPGPYAWWGRFGALPGISGPRHETADLQLLYVGIAPNGTASKSTLRTRVVGDYICGTTGS